MDARNLAPLTLLCLICCITSFQLCAHQFQFELDGNGHEMAYDDTTHTAFISIPSHYEVVFFSLESQQIVERIQLPYQPYGIALSVDKTRLFVALRGAGQVAEIEISSASILQFIDLSTELGQQNTYDVVEAQPNRLFVSASDGIGSIVQVRLDQNNAASRIGGGLSTYAEPFLQADPAGNTLYAYWGSFLKSFDLTQVDAPLVLDERPNFYFPFVVSADSSRLFDFYGRVVSASDLTNLNGLEFENGATTVIPQSGNILATGAFDTDLHHFEVKERQSNSLIVENTWQLRCKGHPDERRYTPPKGLSYLKNGEGFIVLYHDMVCGLIHPTAFPHGYLKFDVSDLIVNELDSSVNVQVCREGPVGSPLTAEIISVNGSSTSDDDYAVTSPQVTFSESQSGCQQRTISIFDNGETTGTRDFSLRLIPLNAQTMVRQGGINIRIIDDESQIVPPNYEFSVIRDLGGPGFEFIIDESRSLIFVSVPETNKVEVFRYPRFEKIHEILLNGPPRGLSLSTDKNVLYVGRSNPAALVSIELDAFAKIGDVDLSAYFLDQAVGEVAAVDNNKILARSAPGPRPRPIVQVTFSTPNQPTIGAVMDNVTSNAGGNFIIGPKGTIVIDRGRGSLYKFSILEEHGPTIQWSSFRGGGFLTYSDELRRLILTDGHVRRFGSFGIEGRLPIGFKAIGTNPRKIYTFLPPSGVFEPEDQVQEYDLESFEAGALWQMPCQTVNDFLIAPNDEGFITISDAQLCALHGSHSGMIHFSQPTFSVAEPSGMVDIEVCRAGGNKGDIQATLSTVFFEDENYGAAVVDVDFTPVSDVPVGFSDQESGCKTILIPILDNTERDGHKIFGVKLVPGSDDVLVSSESDILGNLTNEELAVAGVIILDDEPDISITSNADLSSLLAGQEITVSVVVSNNSSDQIATDITVELPNSPDYSATSANSNQANCQLSTNTRCTIGSLAPLETVNITFVARILSDGQIDLTVDASTSGLDFSPNNNSANWQVTAAALPSAALLRPLIPGAQLIYRDYPLTIDLIDHINLDLEVFHGQTSTGILRENTGSTEYFINNNGLYDLGARDSGGDETYVLPPLKVLAAQPKIGDRISTAGTMHFQRAVEGHLQYPFTSVSEVLEYKDLNLRYIGQNNVLIVKTVLDVAGISNGYQIDLTTEVLQYYVAGLGVVKEIVTPRNNLNGNALSSSEDLYVYSYPDTDTDGLRDNEELLLGTDSAKIDTDEDGLSDGEEVTTHLTDPLNQDSDNDGYTDSAEINSGSDPNDEYSIPMATAIPFIPVAALIFFTIFLTYLALISGLPANGIRQIGNK